MPLEPPLLTAIRWPNNDPSTPGGGRYSSAFTQMTAPATQALAAAATRATNQHYAKPPSRMLRPNMRNRVRAVFLEISPDKFNTHNSPTVRVDVDVATDFMHYVKVPALPPAYWRVAYLLNRRHMFMQAAAQAPSYTPTERAALRASIDLWHVERLRRAITDLLVGLDWEDDPEPGSQVDLLNAWMRTQSLGRQSHLQFSSDPGRRHTFAGRANRRLLAQREADAARANQLVQHARALPQEQRRAYLAANPGTAWLYNQAYSE